MDVSLKIKRKLLHWRHTGFNVHSKLRAETKSEAERVGKYMIRPVLSLKRLFFDETSGQVRYQYCFVSAKFGPLMIFLKRWFAYTETTFGGMYECQEEAIS